MMGLGIAFFFMPLLTMLLSDRDGPEVAEGSGSATFLRTVGASFAVSITTYLWTRGAAASHAHLTEFISLSNPGVRGAVASAGSLRDYAAGINQVINQQALQISFNRSEEHTSELQSLMRISYAVFCLKKKTQNTTNKV